MQKIAAPLGAAIIFPATEEPFLQGTAQKEKSTLSDGLLSYFYGYSSLNRLSPRCGPDCSMRQEKPGRNSDCRQEAHQYHPQRSTRLFFLRPPGRNIVVILILPGCCLPGFLTHLFHLLITHDHSDICVQSFSTLLAEKVFISILMSTALASFRHTPTSFPVIPLSDFHYIRQLLAVSIDKKCIFPTISF